MQLFVRATICSDPCKRDQRVQLWDLTRAGQLLNTRTVLATFCPDSAIKAWSLVMFCLVA